MNNKLIHNVYTDGSCLNNGTANARAGIGVFFGLNHPRNISRKLVLDKVTNNIAEILAILAVLDEMREELGNGDQVVIHTDSTYAIRVCGEYGAKMAKQNWKNSKGMPIPNADLVKIAWNTCKDLPNLSFIYVPAHTGKDDVHSIGNSWADKLAVEGAGGRKVFLQAPKCPAPKRNSFHRSPEHNAAINKISKDKRENEVNSPCTVYVEMKPKANTSTIWLNVPFSEKNDAKALGAWWNPSEQRWYVPTHTKQENAEKLINKWGVQ